MNDLPCSYPGQSGPEPQNDHDQNKPIKITETDPATNSCGYGLAGGGLFFMGLATCSLCDLQREAVRRNLAVEPADGKAIGYFEAVGDR